MIELSLFDVSSSKRANEQKKEAAVASMRDLPYTCIQSEKPEDFRWPRREDLMKMIQDGDVRACMLKWKKSKTYQGIAAVQIVLSNGKNSPVFLGKNQTEDGMNEMVLDSRVRKLQGTKGAWPCQLTLFDKDDAVISKIELNNNNLGEKQVLKEGEEIIGMYGHKNSDGDGVFHTLGFIVWTPPK
jgi:hypothetical protein